MAGVHVRPAGHAPQKVIFGGSAPAMREVSCGRHQPQLFGREKAGQSKLRLGASRLNGRFNFPNTSDTQMVFGLSL